jgi:hypothetical protein
VTVGDNVSVQALVNGSTITAERVTDLTQLQANGKAWQPNFAPPAAGSGSSSSSSGGSVSGDDNGPGPSAA